MSLHLRKFNCEYLVRYIVCLSNIYEEGTGPFTNTVLFEIFAGCKFHNHLQVDCLGFIFANAGRLVV